MSAKPWKRVSRPLTLTVRRRWTWGHDPRVDHPTLISPRGHIFECRWQHGKTFGLFARPYTPFQLAD